MRKKDYFTIAKKLRADIRAHFECLGTGLDQADYLKLRYASAAAVSLARYLGEHLDLPRNMRAEFLELCGLRADALKLE